MKRKNQRSNAVIMKERENKMIDWTKPNRIACIYVEFEEGEGL